jgi:chromosome segregation ATPase
MVELQNDHDLTKTDLQLAQDQNKQLAQQNAVLIEQIRNFEKESFEIQMKVKKGIEAENENKTHGEAISNLKYQERDLQRHIDTLNQQMTLKNSELDRFKGKIETMQSYNTTLETEVADLRNKVAALNDQLHSGQTDTIKQEHAKNQQEIEIFDLKK